MIIDYILSLVACFTLIIDAGVRTFSFCTIKICALSFFLKCSCSHCSCILYDESELIQSRFAWCSILNIRKLTLLMVHRKLTKKFVALLTSNRTTFINLDAKSKVIRMYPNLCKSKGNKKGFTRLVNSCS